MTDCLAGLVEAKLVGLVIAVKLAELAGISDWLVDKLPMWMPPNVLTLLSFSFNVIPHLIIIAIYGNEMRGPIDSWVSVMCGISYFIYTTLDNMDGK